MSAFNLSLTNSTDAPESLQASILRAAAAAAGPAATTGKAKLLAAGEVRKTSPADLVKGSVIAVPLPSDPEAASTWDGIAGAPFALFRIGGPSAGGVASALLLGTTNAETLAPAGWGPLVVLSDLPDELLLLTPGGTFSGIAQARWQEMHAQAGPPAKKPRTEAAPTGDQAAPGESTSLSTHSPHPTTKQHVDNDNVSHAVLVKGTGTEATTDLHAVLRLMDPAIRAAILPGGLKPLDSLEVLGELRRRAHHASVNQEKDLTGTADAAAAFGALERSPVITYPERFLRALQLKWSYPRPVLINTYDFVARGRERHYPPDATKVSADWCSYKAECFKGLANFLRAAFSPAFTGVFDLLLSQLECERIRALLRSFSIKGGLWAFLESVDHRVTTTGQ